MKKTVIIIVSIASVFALVAWLLMKSNGYEIPKKDKFPAIPYFPSISNSDRFKNEVLDTMYAINYYSTDKNIFVLYSLTDNIYDTTYVKIANSSFKSLAHRTLDRRDRFDLDTLIQLLFVFKHDTAGNYLTGETIDLINGKSTFIKPLGENTFNNLKNNLGLFKHATNVNNDTDLLVLKNNQGSYFFMQGDEANKTAKTFHLTDDKNFTDPFGIKIGGDPEIKHQNINLFDEVVTGNHFKRLLSIPTPSSNSSPNNDRMLKNEGYLADNGWFDKDRIFYFKMKLKMAEVKFKTDSYYISDTFFDQLNMPKSDQDTLFYFSKNRIYKFYKSK